MEAEPKRKRRWFQFRLRTLMIVVTLLAVLIGYVGRQYQIINDRNEAVRGHIMVGRVEKFIGPDRTLHVSAPSAPWPLRWLGERGYAAVEVSVTAPDDEVERLKKLFPEAEIVRGLYAP